MEKNIYSTVLLKEDVYDAWHLRGNFGTSPTSVISHLTSGRQDIRLRTSAWAAKLGLTLSPWSPLHVTKSSKVNVANGSSGHIQRVP